MQNQQEKQAKVSQKLKELKSKYEFVFGSKDGQEVLKDIIESGLLNFPSNLSDSNELLIDEGKRQLAYHIKDMATPKKELNPDNQVYIT